MTTNRRWKPGYAEKAYDLMVLLGMNPVPWQLNLLRRIEDRDVDETFCEMTDPMRGGHEPDDTPSSG